VSEHHTISAEARWQAYRRWGVDSLPTGAVLDRTNLTTEWGASLGSELEIGDRSRVRAQVGTRGWTDQYRVDQRGSDTQDAYQRTEDVLGQGRASLQAVVGQRQVVVVGSEVLAERLTADRLQPKTVDRVRVAAFLQDRWDPTGTDVWAVEGVVRADLDSRFGSYVTPRAAIRFAPREDLLLRLSGGRGFRAPDFREMFLVFENAGSGYRVDGTEDLRPETSWNLQGGVELRPTLGTTLAARAFHNELYDLIQADLIDAGGPGEPQRYAYVNVARARTTGGELEAGVQDDDVGAVLLTYRFTDTLDRDLGLPLSGRARHQLTGSARLRLPALRSSASARASLLGPRTYLDATGDETVPYDVPATLQLDATWVVEPSDRFTVNLGVENLLDVGADPETLVQSRPRRVFLGLTGRLGHLGERP